MLQSSASKTTSTPGSLLAAPQWPPVSKSGLHIVASGTLTSPREAVFALVDAMVPSLEPHYEDKAYYVVREQHETILYVVNDPRGPSSYARIEGNYPNTGPDSSPWKLMLKTHNGIAIWVFPDVASFGDFDCAVALMRSGDRVVLGIQAANVAHVVERAQEFKVDIEKLFRRRQCRIDVMAQVDPYPLVLETADSTSKGCSEGVNAALTSWRESNLTRWCWKPPMADHHKDSPAEGGEP